MTKFEVIKGNKERYNKVLVDISQMPDGLAKTVKQVMILEWIKSNNWLGGLNDRKADKLILAICALGYTVDEVIDEFDRQMDMY